MQQLVPASEMDSRIRGHDARAMAASMRDPRCAVDWIGRSRFREAVSARGAPWRHHGPRGPLRAAYPSLRAGVRAWAANLRTLQWIQPANSRLVSKRIVALGLDSFPEILVVVVPGSAILVVEREGFVLVPVAVAAYVIAAIVVVMVPMVLFRMGRACFACLACGRKCEGSQYGGSA